MLDVTQYVNDNFFYTQNTSHFVVVQMEGALYVVMFHQEWLGITKCPQWNTCLCLWVFHFSKCPLYIFLPWYPAGTCLIPTGYHSFFVSKKNSSPFMSCNALEPGHFQNCVILRTPNAAALSYTWYTHWHSVLTKPKNLKTALSTDFHNNVPSSRITFSALHLCYKAIFVC